ncbi:MAG: hypothetical protein ACTSPI_13435, partial [Candidatus Heimdallarchaeaceae archaeon]
DGYKIYLSKEKYPEAAFIHEILHFIIGVEGYPCLDISTFSGLEKKYFADSISNTLDHLVVYHRMKDFDIDDDTLNNLQFEKEAQNIDNLADYSSFHDYRMVFQYFRLSLCHVNYLFFKDGKALIKKIDDKFPYVFGEENEIISRIKQDDFLNKPLSVEEYTGLLNDISELLKEISECEIKDKIWLHVMDRKCMKNQG